MEALAYISNKMEPNMKRPVSATLGKTINIIAEDGAIMRTYQDEIEEQLKSNLYSGIRL